MPKIKSSVALLRLSALHYTRYRIGVDCGPTIARGCSFPRSEPPACVTFDAGVGVAGCEAPRVVEVETDPLRKAYARTEFNKRTVLCNRYAAGKEGSAQTRNGERRARGPSVIRVLPSRRAVHGYNAFRHTDDAACPEPER